MTVDELVRAVRIALGEDPVSMCSACDTDGNEQLTVDELVAAVNRALSGCDAV